MNILGINPGHHSSICLLQDGEIKYFIGEERLTRIKYENSPYKGLLNILSSYPIDYITWATPSIYFPYSDVTEAPHFLGLTVKFSPKAKFIELSHIHHISHAASAFYNSGFKKGISIIIDGLGSSLENLGQETESIFKCSYPNNFELMYKNVFCHSNFSLDKNSQKNINVSPNINLSRVYETITMHLGWRRDEAGKTMGLAPYGKFNSKFPNFFNESNGDPNVFYQDPNKSSLYPKAEKHQHTFINTELYPQLELSKSPQEWHYNKTKITDLEKDLAWRVQNDTQKIVGDYVEKVIKETGLKQICCAGGYFLNCVANYYLQKRFPDVEFYFDPIANDAGTAIGAAKLVWHDHTQDTTIRPLKSLYLGKQYSKKKLLKGIKKYT